MGAYTLSYNEDVFDLPRSRFILDGSKKVRPMRHLGPRHEVSLEDRQVMVPTLTISLKHCVHDVVRVGARIPLPP